MPYLISILAASLLFFGFLSLTLVEARRGARLFARFRYRLDARVSRAQFLFEHIDWGAFTAHLTRTSIETLAHDMAHGTLLLVRSLERGLTRFVRALRMRRDSALPPREPDAPRLTGAVTYLKQNLQRSRKSPPTGMRDIVSREGSGE